MRVLEKTWKRSCQILNQQEKAFIDTYLDFLRSVARACLQAGWRVWFRPNQVVHWGEGGFGRVSIFIPGRRKAILPPELPAEVEFITKLSQKKHGRRNYVDNRRSNHLRAGPMAITQPYECN
jgi:hypothetical protein